MSSSPSPYNSNAAWSAGHYSRSSPAHPSQQTAGPKSTRGMSAEEEEDESDENNDTAEDAPEQNRLSQLKGLFLKDLREIIFGFGDDAPAPDTVSLMEEILIEYLNEVIHNAGHGAGKSLQTEDLRRALSGPGDERKLARLEELIVAQMAIKKARAVGGMDKPTQLAEYQHA